MTSLRTEWLGLKLRNPLSVFSSSTPDGAEKLRRLQEAGAGAAVLEPLLKVRHLGGMLGEVEAWLEGMEHASADDLRGALSQAQCPAPAGFERAQSIRKLVGFE